MDDEKTQKSRIRFLFSLLKDAGFHLKDNFLYSK